MQYITLPREVVSVLSDWYRTVSRDLPWRRDPSPYGVWISEIMLQQTRIEAVIPYYNRFMAELPRVEALAACDDDRLMKLWQGLGYYSRARNLKKAAITIVKDHGGNLPADYDALRKLSGIGDYTAGAIGSIAFGLPTPAVDGNVMRVVTRIAAWGEDIAKPQTKRDITQALGEIYPSGDEASLFTQGLMELGEAVCIPNGVPKCAECPLSHLCLAYGQGNPTDYPVKSPKKPRRVEEKWVFLLSCKGKYAIRKRPESGLLAALWEFPNRPKEGTPEDFLANWGLQPETIEKGPDGVHIFTHVEWHMTGIRATLPEPHPDFTWATPDEILGIYAVPTAFKVFLKEMENEKEK